VSLTVDGGKLGRGHESCKKGYDGDKKEGVSEMKGAWSAKSGNTHKDQGEWNT